MKILKKYVLPFLGCVATVIALWFFLVLVFSL